MYGGVTFYTDGGIKYLSVSLCERCGAVIFDEYQHDIWHVQQDQDRI